VEAWTLKRTKDDVMSILNEAHVPCAPVRNAREILNDPHLNERGMWVDVEHPRRGKTRVPISPIRFHGCPPASVDRPAPLLGADTDRVLSELLGVGTDELATLHASGVIEPAKN
jgi:crotonobetainyl-CoA:carnitine CoA-transferase CaiB-like acyl-CoA transferase